MKKKLTLFIFALFAVAAYSQTIDNLKITKSPVFKTEGDYFQAMLKDSLGNVYILRSKHSLITTQKTKWVLEKHNPDLSLAFSKDLPSIELNGKELLYLEAHTINGMPYLFFKGFNKQENKEELYRIAVLGDGTLSKAEVIASYKLERKEEAEPQLLFSRDSSHFMVLYTIRSPKLRSKLSYTIFDKTCRKEFENSYQHIGDENNFRFFDYELANDARFYAASLYSGKKGDVCELYEFSPKEPTPKMVNLDIEITTSFYLDLLELKDGAMSVIYRNTMGNNWNTCGIGFLKIGKSGMEVTERKQIVFDNATFKFFKLDEKEIAQNKGINFLAFSNIWLAQDGNVVVVLEKRLSGPPNTPQSDAGSAIIVKLDENGNKLNEWVHAKQMVSILSNRGGISILGMDKKGMPLFLHNDVTENLGKPFNLYDEPKGGAIPSPGNRALGASTNIVGVCWAQNKAGALTYQTLFGTEADGVYLNTSGYLDIGPNTIIVMGSNVDFKNNKYLLAKLEF